jgi:hypothetical protein
VHYSTPRRRRSGILSSVTGAILARLPAPRLFCAAQ